jgi:hypothetical protein
MEVARSVCLIQKPESIPYLYVSSYPAAQPELVAHYLPQVCPDCCAERVVRPLVGTDRVETPHTDQTRMERGAVVVIAKSVEDSRRTSAVKAGGSDYESYGDRVVVGMAVEAVDGRPWCTCRSERI